MTGLYVFMGMGFLASRKLGLGREGVSRLLFYLIVPLVFFHGVSRVPMQGMMLALPLVVMAIASLLGLLGYALARLWWPEGDRAPNIIGFTAGNGNMGYFGIPVALMIFDTPTVAIYMLMIIGVIFYEATVGYVIATRGQFHPKQALKKIATMPMLHGALGGVIIATLQVPLPEFMEDFFVAIRGTYSVLGMMMIGMGLAGLTRFEIDIKFVSLTFGLKFLCWPLAAAGFVWLDANVLHWYAENLHDALMLLSLAPLAVMSVIFATLYDAHPEKMATAVFLSTCFALTYVPLMVSWFIVK